MMIANIIHYINLLSFNKTVMLLFKYCTVLIAADMYNVWHADKVVRCEECHGFSFIVDYIHPLVKS